MKRFLLVLLAVAVPSATAHADAIGLYSDPSGDFCAGPTQPFATNTVYVLHQFSTGATQSTWQVTNTAAVMIPVGSSCSQLSIQGSPFTGITVFYPGCQAGSFVICELQYFKTSTDPVAGCYQLHVEGYNNVSPTYLDCNDNEAAADGGFYTFDIEGKDTCFDCSIPVESTTWGHVKSLYR